MGKLYTYIEVHKLQFRFISDQEISSEKLKRLVVFRQGIKKIMFLLEICLLLFQKKKFFFFSMTLRRTEGNELTCMSRDKNVESDKTMSRLSGKRFEFHSLYKEVPQGKVHKKRKNKCNI